MVERPCRPRILLTADDFLRIGLDWAGFNAFRRENVNEATNIQRFKSHFGSSPIVYANVWEDLLTTEVDEARINPRSKVENFFLSLYFLNVYPTEEKLAGLSKTCETSARKWAWFFARKVQALKVKKIVWPEGWTAEACINTNPGNNATPRFLYSVDGVHCRTNEVIHPTLAKNTKLYSHKFNQAGVDYELALSLRDSSLVWIAGPFVGSKHDVTVFRECGLKDKTPDSRKGIADQGYRGEKYILCTPNSHDTLELRTFKSRARARHETFNARIKTFACLDQRFRHGMDKHKVCFEAVCVIVQYQLELGSPLFDI
ncbi:hypothetical protein MHU86_21990 [Fragilaria crotonensis]|nr:hypothetical protein MHU86_21990 [Fragilaria crotonensis]